MKQQVQEENSEIIGFVPVRGMQRQESRSSAGLLPLGIIAIAGMIALSSFGSYFFARSQNTQSQIIQAQDRAVNAERKRFTQCIEGGNW
jgi:hypothetical protein